jgi:tryptophan-rich sensory protein
MMQPPRSIVADILGLAVFLGLCFGAAGLGAAVTTPEIDGWYAELAKPAWNPPNWIFGPVWTVLYLTMGVSAWLVWRQAGLFQARVSLGLFALQLALNTLWSFLFFAWHRPDLAAIEILLLWVAILSTQAAIWRHSRPAAALLAPYLAWVTFAAALNVTIWRMQ